MAGTLVSNIVMAVNGLPIVHLRSLDYKVNTGRELAQGMTPSGDPLGFSDGTKTYELDLEVYIPVTGDLQWEDISGAVIAVKPRDGGVLVPIFIGVFVKNVSTTFKEQGSALRRISCGALKKIGVG